MARARAVDTRLERQLPAVDEFYTSGFLTKEELLELTRTRTHWEYRLVAKPLLLLDIQNAVKFELALEERLRQYCQRTKVSLKHRWSILERIEYLYGVGVKRLKDKADKETNRTEFVRFLKCFNRMGTLSKLYGQLMVQFPKRSDIWVEAALWEGLERQNMDNARGIVQQALVTMSRDPSVWAAALRLELAFVDRLMDGVLEEHAAQRSKKQRASKRPSGESKGDSEEERPLSETLRAEDEAMGDLILGLALAKAVVDEAVESPASGPDLLKRFLAVCAEYCFAKEVAVAAVDGTARKLMDVLLRCRSTTSPATATPVGGAAAATGGAPTEPSQRERTRWREGGLPFVLRSYLLVEDVCTSEGRVPLRSAAAFLDEAAAGPDNEDLADRKRRAASSAAQPADHHHAAMASLAALLVFAALPTSVHSAVSAGQPPQVVWQEVVVAGATRLFHSLAATTSHEAVSHVCLSLLLAPSHAIDAKRIRSALEHLLLAEGGRVNSSKEVEVAYVKPAQTRVRELVADAVAAAEHTPTKRPRTSGVDGEASAEEEGDVRWPVSALSGFLTPADRKALSAAHRGTDKLSALSTARCVTSEDVEELLLWWRVEEKAAAAEDGEREGAAAAAALRARLRKAAFRFFCRFGLVPPCSGGTGNGTAEEQEEEEGEENGASEPSSPPKKRRRGGRKAVSAPSSRPGAALSHAEGFSCQHPLLLLSNGVCFSDARKTPLCIWRVFNALEATEGSRLFDALHSRNGAEHALSSHGSSSGSDDEEESKEGGAGRQRLPPHFQSYAAAGAHFLATAQHSVLDRQGQLDRAVGLWALSRSRLFSLTGVRASANPATTRADVLNYLSEGHSASDVSVRIAEMHSLVKHLELRCQPVPRQCYTTIVIPFLEAVALSLVDGHGTPPSAQDAVKQARAAHERLLLLYGFTQHPEGFIPLLYHSGAPRDGGESGPSASSPSSLLQPKHSEFKASGCLVSQFSVDDWVSYVRFERSVAKDLDRSRAVTERARRACLAPQQLLVQLSNIGV